MVSRIVNKNNNRIRVSFPLGVAIFLMISIIVTASCTKTFKRVDYTDKTAYLLCSLRERNLPLTNAQRFGFFSSKLWKDYEISLKEEINVFGATPGYILWYLQMGDGFPLHIVEHNKKLGIATVINQDIRSDQLNPEQNTLLLKEIADGKWDDYFRKFARQAREMDTKIYYRFGYEMNGNWFPWGQNRKVFVAAWKHTWRIFKKEQADSVKWIFSPSVVWGTMTFEEDILPYYPGDEYVDIVALDGYNFGDRHDQFHQWESFYDVYSGSITGLMNFNKPMWIAEIGCPSDSRRHQWLRDFLQFFDSNTCFEVFFWFNENKHDEPNFRIDADYASLAVFREWAQRVNRKSNFTDELAQKSENNQSHNY